MKSLPPSIALAVLLVSLSPGRAHACKCVTSDAVHATWLGREDSIRTDEHFFVAIEPARDTPVRDIAPDPLPRHAEEEWIAITLLEGRRRIPLHIARRFGRNRVVVEVVPDAPLHEDSTVRVELVYARRSADENVHVLLRYLGGDSPIDREPVPIPIVTATVVTLRVRPASSPTLAWTGPTSATRLVDEGTSCSDGATMLDVALGTLPPDALVAVRTPTGPDVFVVRPSQDGTLHLDSSPPCGGASTLPEGPTLRLAAMTLAGEPIGQAYDLTVPTDGAPSRVAPASDPSNAVDSVPVASARADGSVSDAGEPVVVPVLAPDEATSGSASSYSLGFAAAVGLGVVAAIVRRTQRPRR